MKLQHGTYECCVGTETIDGCDCGPSTAAWKMRLEAKKSFTYYKKPETIKTVAKRRRRELVAA
jgi:hypothetical protein